jgi:hypothetical protein
MKDIHPAGGENRDVFVLGAGFTKAFFLKAPLLVDEYDLRDISEKYKKFDQAYRILDIEMTKRDDGRIDIERLITRLQDCMPYDFDIGSQQQLSMLLADVKNCFLRRIKEARDGANYVEDLKEFAKYCVTNTTNIVTFNYDDFLDEAIWSVAGALSPINEPYWNPDGGYGFFCKPSSCVIEAKSVQMDLNVAIKLLKLHGSINWRIGKGASHPYSMDTIVHDESWYQPELYDSCSGVVNLHLESEPLVVPPTLTKTAFYEQPILRSVWYLAYELLLKAHKVTFIGCGLPATDILARTLMTESLALVHKEDIYVVNVAGTDEEKQKIQNDYRSIFGALEEEQFCFNGALEWSRQLVNHNRPESNNGNQ